MEQNQVDVAILGGGLAGLTLARQILMQNPETRVLLVEKRTFPVSETTFKVGESSVEIGAHYLSEELQLKKHLTDEQLPKFGLRFFLSRGVENLADGAEVGGSEFFPAPSYQMDRGRLENYLAELVVDQGATLLTGARVRQVEFAEKESAGEPNAHRVTLLRNGETETISARWLVDASGRASFLKRQLDVGEDLDHNINAVWFRIGKDIRVDQWCDDPHWRSRSGKVPRRWLSTNHLLGTGYWVWLIPLASGSTSIGIVADPRLHPLNEMNSFEKAMNWLEKYEPHCAQSIREHEDKLQDFLAIKRMARGARQVYSANRWGLTGEAAVFLDPLYSPGLDYIAMGNTMIAKLIEEDAKGTPLEHLAPTFQSIFLTLFHNNLLTYQDQYPLFGNPRIMSLKIMWDYVVYWTFPALLYFNGKLTDPRFIQSLGSGIEEMREMNLKMQEFFREWYESDPSDQVEPIYIDQRQNELLFQLNGELKEKLPDDELRARFQRNVGIVRDLMHEMIGRVRKVQPRLAAEIAARPVAEPRLEGVFEAINL